jgi:hypothetical protein
VTVRLLSAEVQSLPIGGRWLIDVLVTDDDGYEVDVAPTVTVTLPDSSTSAPVPEHTDAGRYRAAYTMAAAGRHTARVVAAGYGAADLAAYTAAATTQAGMPTVAGYRGYDEDGGGSWSDPAIQDALDAEAAAQRNACRVGAVYEADLRQALLRRVQCNLARRRLPLAVLQGDAEAGSAATMPPGRDPEVRRLEAPHRKLVMG